MTVDLSTKQRIILDYFKKSIVLSISFIMMIICSDVTKLKYLGIYIVAVSILYVIEVRNNILSLIVGAFLAYFNYSIIYANYFSNIDSFFLRDANKAVSLTGLRVLCCFITIIFVLTDFQSISDNKSEIIDFSYNGESSSIIAIGYIVVLIFILIYGFSRPAVFGERGSPSPMYEYSISFFIVGYYYFRNHKLYLIISSGLLFLFALQNIMYGGRVTAIQEFIIFFVLFVNKETMPDYLKIIPIICIGLILFSAIGSFRASFNLSNEQLFETINNIKKTGLTLDTSYAAYYCSLTFIKTEDILSLTDRIVVFFNWCVSQLLGGSLVPNSNVSVITRHYFIHYYGGVLPFFGHFHFGYLGVILFSSLPLVYISKIANFNKLSGITKCILLFFVVTTPRWYLYSPSPLIRGVLLTMILFLSTDSANKLVKKRYYY